MLFALSLILFSNLIGLLFLFLFGVLQITLDNSVMMLLAQSIALISITTATFLAVRILNRRPIGSLGLTITGQSLRDILVGIAISCLQMGLIFVLELGLGWIKFEGFAWESLSPAEILSGTVVWLLIFVIVGWQEELLSRGYLLQTIESGSTLFWGVLLSSVIFGIFHIFNPGADWVSTIGLIFAGVFLALPYILTRQLWLSIGLHIGWNFFEGVVFGFKVSGLATFRLINHSTISGMNIWTGGAFGPEAGLIILPVLLFGSFLIILYTRPGFRKKR